jgi:starch phosphorylase
LALDLRWTFRHEGDTLWRALDADTWERTRNPWFLLQSVPEARLRALASDDAFKRELARLASPAPALAVDATVAYFSMEFAIGEAIPLYAGGLGVLAGDYLKTASDLNLPIVGVGLLYQEGYFRQTISADGHQHESYPYTDPTALPIEPVRAPTGGWLRVTVELPGRALWLRVWRARIGRVSLLLLDSNDLFNTPGDRGITCKLYAGGVERRLLQEIVLGIGGWRALEAIGIAPAVAHLNEGHAAFAVVERARSFVARERVSFAEALWATRAGNVFTTHTPVAAGFDSFAPELVEKYFTGATLHELGIAAAELLGLGRRDPRDHAEPFNMAYLAMRGCARANGVSRLHAEVSRRIFAPLFPRVPEHEIPIGHITNGVHMPSWAADDADVRALTDEDLWRRRCLGRRLLVERARARLHIQLLQRGLADGVEHILDPEVLTLGFARRFVEYKRPTLLLRDRERLTRLLDDPTRPIQIVVAGKAHPADEAGKRMIEEWIAFASRPEARTRVVFLEDYDLELAAEMVQGVDVWVNTPRRPWEACGTSGMKVLPSGGLNLSSLDGWWAEAFTPEVGWAIGDGHDDASADAYDADELYALLERSIAPEFYDRGADGLPRRWLARMRASMERLVPEFSAERMAREYGEKLYAPAAAAYRARSADSARLARELAIWQNALEAHWQKIDFGALETSAHDGRMQVGLRMRLGELDPAAVHVELYADGVDGEPEMHVPLARADGSDGEIALAATVATKRPASDFTPRVVPRHPAATLPMELPLVGWLR